MIKKGITKRKQKERVKYVKWKEKKQRVGEEEGNKQENKKESERKQEEGEEETKGDRKKIERGRGGS